MSIQKIVCCVDFSINAEKAFQAALELAEKFEAQLRLLYVVPPVVNPHMVDDTIAISKVAEKSLVLEIEEQLISEYAKKIGEQIDHVIVIKDGHVSSEIIQYLAEEKIDVVILGAYGLSGVELVLFGSVAKRVAHKAPCSVMIVR